MEKKVGKYLAILLLFFASIVQALDQSIIISVHDIDGQNLKQAMVNTQFLLQIVVHNISVTNDIPQVQGIDQFRYVFNGRYQSFSTFNSRSNSQVMYKFLVQADSSGVYQLGPVRCTEKSGKIFESNQLEISVGNEILINDKQNQKKRYEFTAEFDKKQVYVREKVTLRISFLDYVFIDQFQLDLPYFEDFTVTRVYQEKNKISSLDSNNQEYLTTQWAIDCYPHRTGFLVAKDIKIRFVDHIERNDIFGLMNFIMGEEKQLSARSVGLEVLALPNVKNFHDIQAVGQFSKIDASTTVHEIEQGQGFSLKIDLFGQGNLEMIDSLPLSLPENFISYDSGASKIDMSKDCKHFEYIIQAQQPGTYEIPSQIFNYFDPLADHYKTLRTDPLEIVITPSTHTYQDPDVVVPEDDFLQEDRATLYTYKLLDQKCIHSYYPTISLVWYIFFMKIILLLFLCMVFYRYFFKKYVIDNNNLRRFVIFFQAKRACKVAQAQGNVQALHTIFMYLFVHLKIATLSLVNDVTIEKYFKSKNFSGQQIQQWNVFYKKLLQASFSQSNPQKSSLLFNEAFAWLHLFKMKL